jgi:hypothetical protein
LLRAPLPMGWQVDSVDVDGAPPTRLNGDAVDLSGPTTPCAVRFSVKHS